MVCKLSVGSGVEVVMYIIASRVWAIGLMKRIRAVRDGMTSMNEPGKSMAGLSEECHFLRG